MKGIQKSKWYLFQHCGFRRILAETFFLLDTAVVHTKVPPNRQTITANIHRRSLQDRGTKTKRKKTTLAVAIPKLRN